MTPFNKLYFLGSFLLCLFFSHQNIFATNGCYTVCFGAEGEEQTTYLCENDIEEEHLLSSFDEQTKDIPDYQAGQLYLKIKDELTMDITYNEETILGSKYLGRLIPDYRITSVEVAFKRLPQMIQYYKIKFEETDETDELLRALEELAFVEFAERVPLHRIFLTPNDIHPDQYNVLITNTEPAWDITTGDFDIVIGMVDDAVLLDHEDLAGNIWTNVGEIPGNGVDDDGNGYIDDINGWDAADNDPDPNPLNPTDNYFSHGTHCAGIAAAVTDNGIGIAAPSFNVQLMAVKIGADSDSGLSGAYAGVEYAIAAGADVISMSWGGGAFAETNQAVLNVAHDAGIVLVAAAGNDNTDNFMYPASYEHVISVGASDNGDMKAGFSNYGDSIDVMAPGVDIWSSVATTTSSYTSYDGTSMACPFVSGLAALMLSFDPTATPERIEQCLEDTADDIDGLNPGFEGALGAGRVNSQMAVQCTPSVPFAAFNWSPEIPCTGETFTFLDQSGGTELNSWNWSFPGGTPSSSTDQNPVVSYPADGTYEATLIVGNALGADTLTQTVTVAPPSATISGDAIILLGYIVPVEINFTGSAPYSVTYSDGSSTTTVNGITDNPYVMMVSPETTITYTVTAFSNDYCTGTFGGSATVVVIVPTETNDICDNALPFPDLMIGVENCINGNNNSANGELPYISQANCLGGEMPVPSADVWFTFEAVSNILDVEITYDMDTAVVGLYEGTCDALIGRECDTDYGSGVLNTTFAPVTPGQTYYLQISGGSLTDQGNFTLCLENYGEDEDEICMLGQSLMVNPPPASGAYLPGQLVTFCFTVNGYNQNAADWIHGIVPQLGASWDASTLAPVLPFPPNCDGDGEWGWYASVTGTAASALPAQGPGFFYDKGGDGDPGNNFGDNDGASNCTWEFCFEVAAVATCPPGMDGDDLSIIFRNFSDSETGSWNSSSICPEDPEYQFKAVLSCCAAPEMSGTDPTCTEPDIGTVTAIATNGVAPFTFEWNTGLTETDPISSSIADLTAGFYVVTVTDSEGCFKEASYTLIQDNPGFPIDIMPTEPIICLGDSVELVASGGVAYFWAPATGLSDQYIANPYAKPEVTTDYIVVVSAADGCSNYTQVTVEVITTPPPIEAGDGVAICGGESAQLQASGGVSYVWEPAATLDNPNIANPIATPNNTTIYTVTGTAANGCVATDQVTVYIAPQPYFPAAEIDTTICLGETLEIQLTDVNPISNYDYIWTPTTGLDDPTTSNPTATIDESEVYTVVVSNEHGCETTRTVTINLESEGLSVDLGIDTVLCNGAGFTLFADGPFSDYLWSDGSTEPTLGVTTSGMYSVSVTNAANCVAIDSIEVIAEAINPVITGDLTIDQGQTTELSTMIEYAEYEWTTGETSSTIIVGEAGDYGVTTYGENGCSGSHSVTVEVLIRNDVLIPNAFSPNDDGINDVFSTISTTPLISYDMAIYNRWGNRIFETKDPTDGWDGKTNGQKADMGVYAYYLNVVFADGSEKLYRGNITLIW